MLEKIGYGPHVAEGYARWAACSDASVGRVLHTDAGVVTVLAEDGTHRVGLGGALLGEAAGDPSAAPCPGDWVVLRRWPDRRTTLEAVLPRRTSVAWPPAQGAPVACANVDVAVLVGPGTVRPARAVVTPGVEVVPWDGTDEQAARLRARVSGGLTVAVIGPDGRDKAALVRALAGAEVLAGRAAPTWLVPLPGGGALVDVAGPTRAHGAAGVRP